MSTKNDHHRPDEESFKESAVDFLGRQGGNIEAAAAELGVDHADLRAWKRKAGVRGKPLKSMGAMAQLRAENEALRSQVLSLQGQWDILRSTLGVLSTTVCSHESA